MVKLNLQRMGLTLVLTCSKRNKNGSSTGRPPFYYCVHCFGSRFCFIHSAARPIPVLPRVLAHVGRVPVHAGLAHPLSWRPARARQPRPHAVGKAAEVLEVRDPPLRRVHEQYAVRWSVSQSVNRRARVEHFTHALGDGRDGTCLGEGQVAVPRAPQVPDLLRTLGAFVRREVRQR